MIEPTNETLRRWLLQRLPPEDAEPFEQRLLEDDAFAERLRAVETDLLDDLARGRLDAAEQAAARRLFANPQGRQRLRIAQALAQVARRSAPRVHGARWHRRWLVGGAAVAAALVIAAIGLRERVVETPATTDSAATPTVTLLAATMRSAGGAEDVRIAPGANAVRLQAEVDGDDTDVRYGLEIRAGERAVFRGADLPARVAGPYRYVEATVPAQVFDAGSVEVRLVAAGDAQPARTWTLHIRRD